ncbi:hypothetical protein [Sandaracinus amylolyticus]|uniref:Lipoprotein n=1 Tax=Sandaracinus amylolyticus TaxID=927083 RepID=A0A0F6YGA1_9BACT|nr:hypothetical protein [Sandaracinus amylolyticus]AKF03670.1 hypothetical protein DB32_000819 [Sandaracinus amylolyticus]
MRTMLATVWVLTMLAAGCGGMPPVYERLPRAVRSSVRHDFPDCADVRGFMIEPAEGRPRRGDTVRYEVRSCGLNAIYVCSHGDRRTPCDLEHVIASNAGGEVTIAQSEAVLEVMPPPAATALLGAPAMRAAPEIEALAFEWEAESLEGSTALLVSGPIGIVGGFGLALYEGLRGARFCVLSPCAERTIFPNDGVVALGLAIGGLGVISTVTGGIWRAIVSNRRGELHRAMRDRCRELSFGTGPTLLGVSASICFP